MGFSRIKECLDLVIFCLSSISLQLPPPSPCLLSFCIFMCASSARARMSPKITLRYPHNQTTNDNIIAQAFQNRTQKKGVVATLTCKNPLIDPCGFCISPPLSPLFSRLSYIPPLHSSTPPCSASLRASVEIRSSLSEVLCHVAQGAWNSPRAVEQTQAQGLSIVAPQTNCLSNEPPSLSCPHTHVQRL